jgi:hypothetical protein
MMVGALNNLSILFLVSVTIDDRSVPTVSASCTIICQKLARYGAQLLFIYNNGSQKNFFLYIIIIVDLLLPSSDPNGK